MQPDPTRDGGLPMPVTEASRLEASGAADRTISSAPVVGPHGAS